VTLSGLGQATFNTSNLALGTYTVTAVYSGDQNYAPATLSVSTFQIINPSVLITANPSSLSVTAGTPGSVSLTLQGLVGFGGPTVAVTLACVNSTLPQYAECSFDNPSVALTTAGGSATIVLTINTNVASNSAAAGPGPAPWTFAGILSCGLIGFVFRKRTRFNPRIMTALCLMLMLACSVFGVTGCTNSGYTHTPPVPVFTTPSGTSQVAVTATYNGAVKSLPFTLPVTVK
jgi:hypothetical protein